MASRLCPLTVGLLVSTHSCTVPPLYTQIVRQQQVPAELLYAVASSESGTHMYPVAVSVPLPQCEHWLQTAPPSAKGDDPLLHDGVELHEGRVTSPRHDRPGHTLVLPLSLAKPDWRSC